MKEGDADYISPVVWQKLQVQSVRLNELSDKLSKIVEPLEADLKQLGLGVPAWVKFSGETDADTGDFWDHSIGYAKVNGRWGIALMARTGNVADGKAAVERWLFSDSPRMLRLEGVKHVGAVLVALEGEASKLASAIETAVGGTVKV